MANDSDSSLAALGRPSVAGVPAWYGRIMQMAASLELFDPRGIYAYCFCVPTEELNSALSS